MAKKVSVTNVSGKVYIPCWMLIMGSIVPRMCIQKLSRKTDITYSHTHAIIKELVKKNWVVVKKVGRNNRLYLTEDGLVVKNSIKMLVKKLK